MKPVVFFLSAVVLFLSSCAASPSEEEKNNSNPVIDTESYISLTLNDTSYHFNKGYQSGYATNHDGTDQYADTAFGLWVTNDFYTILIAMKDQYLTNYMGEPSNYIIMFFHSNICGSYTDNSLETGIITDLKKFIFSNTVINITSMGPQFIEGTFKGDAYSNLNAPPIPFSNGKIHVTRVSDGEFF